MGCGGACGVGGAGLQAAAQRGCLSCRRLTPCTAALPCAPLAPWCARRRGETFDRQRHACGTEVKAITYSAMQINEGEGDAEVFVIVDI